MPSRHRVVPSCSAPRVSTSVPGRTSGAVPPVPTPIPTSIPTTLVPPTDRTRWTSRRRRLVGSLTPVVAAIQGAAIGAGFGLACLADFRVGCLEARFAANFARLGYHHILGLSVTLPALVGQQHALDLLYTGRRVKGEEALALGLIDRLTMLESVRAEAHAMAAQIAASAPLAVRAIRQTMRSGLGERFGVATEREAAAQASLATTWDLTEGVRAAGERRAPQFEAR